MSLKRFKDALDRGGPLRVKVIFVSLIVGWFLLGLLPFHLREHVALPLIWFIVHVGMLWKELKEKQVANKDQDTEHHSLVMSDSLRNE